jgi:hypothetical protein
MAKEIFFEGTFKTVKLDKGKYQLILIDKDGKENIIGENEKLVGCKNDAKEYVLEKDSKATHYKMIHHKPGREKDAKEVRRTKAL